MLAAGGTTTRSFAGVTSSSVRLIRHRALAFLDFQGMNGHEALAVAWPSMWPGHSEARLARPLTGRSGWISSFSQASCLSLSGLSAR